MGWAARARQFGGSSADNGERLRAHVVALAMTHEINVYESDHPRRRGRGAVMPGAVICPTVRDSESYAICLHEFGHLCEPCRPDHALVQIRADDDTTTTTDGRVLRGKWICVPCEIAAWRWARAHAIEWNATMQTALRVSQLHYRPWANPAERDAIDALTLIEG